jgi:16S rRNA (uracil1498-N3)-methyltransferase
MFLVAHPCAVGDRVTVAGAEGHHAADVMRLASGEVVLLTDGRGRLMHGVVDVARRGELEANVTKVVEVAAPQPQDCVVQALAKGGRDEDAVEAMTEVGVDEFIGWQAARSIAKWTDRTPARWESTVRAAAKQSRRAWWPTVAGPLTTTDVVDRVSAADLALVLDAVGTTAIGSVKPPATGEIVIIVGPEGGITEEELETFRAAGAQPVGLGDGVLRSSTAGVVAAGVLLSATRWRR